MCVLDCSFGTLARLCIVRLCGLRLFQFHHPESGEHDQLEHRSSDFASINSNWNGSIRYTRDDGVVSTFHQHRTCLAVHETGTRATDFTKTNQRLAIQRYKPKHFNLISSYRISFFPFSLSSHSRTHSSRFD